MENRAALSRAERERTNNARPVRDSPFQREGCKIGGVDAGARPRPRSACLPVCRVPPSRAPRPFLPACSSVVDGFPDRRCPARSQSVRRRSRGSVSPTKRRATRIPLARERECHTDGVHSSTTRFRSSGDEPGLLPRADDDPSGRVYDESLNSLSFSLLSISLSGRATRTYGGGTSEDTRARFVSLATRRESRVASWRILIRYSLPRFHPRSRGI